jgi:MFS family permease
MTATRVLRTYYGVSALFTLSTSVIWGVSTLFLLDAGLNIFGVMLVNATFSAGQIVFEVPTGVIADTVGRRVSFLLGIGTLIVGTLFYVGSTMLGWGVPGFIAASVLTGFGFTCQTGAVDAWLVDALDAGGYRGSKHRVFAHMGMYTGVAMVIGTLGGGLLGQIGLAVPYVVRTALLVLAFAVTAVFMRDVGFEPRPLRLSSFADESRKILVAGVNHGWRHKVIRPLLFVSAANGLIIWYLFHASPPYVLELLDREDLIWVAGAITSLFALAGVAGNALVGRVSRSRLGAHPASVLMVGTAGLCLIAIGIGVTGLVSGGRGNSVAFAVAAALLAGYGMIGGILIPIRAGFINEFIPSAQRATVLSFDSFFADIGAVGGQLGFGAIAQGASKALAYTIGGVVYLVAVPLYRRAGAAARKAARAS